MVAARNIYFRLFNRQLCTAMTRLLIGISSLVVDWMFAAIRGCFAQKSACVSIHLYHHPTRINSP